jgi:hypothetical protein
MIIHLKNITADHYVISQFLLGIGLKDYAINKDTYTIENGTDELYQEIVNFANELKANNKIIFIKKNGL